MHVESYIFSYLFFLLADFGAGIAGSAVSGAIGGIGTAITTTTPLGRIAAPVVNSAFGVTASVAGNLVEQLLDSKPGIDKLDVLEAGALGLISAHVDIPIKIKSYVGKAFNGKTSISC